MAAPSDHRPEVTRWIALLGIGALALFLTLHRLGAAGVCSYDEAIEGLFVQQMVEHGGGLFPLANGRDAMYKPPLFHWTALAIDRAAAGSARLRRLTCACRRRFTAPRVFY